MRLSYTSLNRSPTSLAYLINSVASFSPISLFSAGEQGFWLDPSDVANLDWRRNLLTFTEQFDNAAWVKTRTTVTSNAVIAPDGTLTADTLTASADDPYVQQNIVASARTYTWSVYLKGAGSSIGKQPTLRIGRDDYTELFNLIAPALTANWQRYIFSATFVTTPVFNVNARVDFVEGNDLVGLTVDFWGAQLELGSSVTDYQRISDVNTEVLERFPTTTMFTDRAGTTAVTTPGQTVGLRLDKSKGLTLGSELRALGSIFTAGAPAFVATYSTVTGAGTSYRTDASNTSGVRIDVPDTDGLTLLIDLEVSTGTVQIRTDGPLGTVLATISVGRTTLRLSNPTANTICLCSGTNGTGNTFTLHSIRELPGNHAVAPTDAARPTYGIEPKTGRRNLLTRTEEFGDAVWSLTGVTVAGNIAIAPDGTTTAEKVTVDTANSFHRLAAPTQNLSVTNHTLSVYMKAAEYTSGGLTLFDGSVFTGRATFDLSAGTVSILAGTATITPVGDGWYRCTVTGNGAAVTSVFISINSVFTFTGNGTSGIYIWGAQLETGSTATAYQRVGTAFDVTEAGVPTVHYVQYDGTDDSFSTSSIDFTATNKMSVFAGVRKLSDAALGMAAELSVDASANSGSFRLIMPGSAGYEYRQRGSLNAAGASVGAGFAAPITNVITGLGDISGDTTTLRINGTQVAQATNDQGTGNYGNYPIFIGRRNNATLPFNGRDYGIIIVGKTASASEIAATESWLAAKTSGVTI